MISWSDKAARTGAAGVEIYVEGMVDEAAEQQRQGKRIDELTKLRDTLLARLANRSYTDKAPPHLVEQNP